MDSADYDYGKIVALHISGVNRMIYFRIEGAYGVFDRKFKGAGLSEK